MCTLVYAFPVPVDAAGRVATTVLDNMVRCVCVCMSTHSQSK